MPDIPCCFVGFGCIEMNLADCIAQGGEQVEECTLELCDESASQTIPAAEGCVDPTPFLDGFSALKPYHTLDLCEQTIMMPTFIGDLDEGNRMEPVSDHYSRILGSGINSCVRTEGFVAMDDDNEAHLYVCTRRAAGDFEYYAIGDPYIEHLDQDGDDQDDAHKIWLNKAEAAFIAATEAPFYLETFMWSDPIICVEPTE